MIAWVVEFKISEHFLPCVNCSCKCNCWNAVLKIYDSEWLKLLDQISCLNVYMLQLSNSDKSNLIENTKNKNRQSEIKQGILKIEK